MSVLWHQVEACEPYEHLRIVLLSGFLLSAFNRTSTNESVLRAFGGRGFAGCAQRSQALETYDLVHPL